MEYEKLIQLSEITKELLTIKENIKELRFKVSELEVHISFLDFNNDNFVGEAKKLLVNAEFLNLKTEVKIKKIDTIKDRLIALTIELIGAPKQTTVKLEQGFEAIEDCFLDVYELKKHNDSFKEQLMSHRNEMLKNKLDTFESIGVKLDFLNEIIKRNNIFLKNIANNFLEKVKNTENENNSDIVELTRYSTLKILLSKLDCILDEFENISEHLNALEKLTADESIKESITTTKKVSEIKINYCNKLIWSFKRVSSTLQSKTSKIDINIKQNFIEENNKFAQL